MLAERGVDVREQRPERDRDRHSDDGPQRRHRPRRLQDEAQPDAEKRGVEHVAFLVHGRASTPGMKGDSLADRTRWIITLTRPLPGDP
jgi:hypothetical protein